MVLRLWEVPLCEGRVNIAQVHQVQQDKEERVTRRYNALRGGVKIAVYGCLESCGAGSVIHLCSGGVAYRYGHAFLKGSRWRRAGRVGHALGQ